MRKFLEKKKYLNRLLGEKINLAAQHLAEDFFLIHNLPKVFLERIENSYQGQLLEFLKIKKIRARLEKGPVFDSKFIRILVASLMIAHLEKKSHESSKRA